MKKLFINAFAFTALFALMSNACDDLKESINLNIPLDIEETVEISTDQPGSISEVFNTKENTNISKYLGKIDALTLSKVSYEIKTLAGHTAGTTLNLSLKYSALNSEDGIGLLSSENIFATLNEEIEIDLTQAELDAIADLFKKDGKFKVYLEGEADGPIEAEVILRFAGKFDAIQI